MSGTPSAGPPCPANDRDGSRAIVVDAALVAMARWLLESRRRFEQRFAADLFADPARDILLSLFASEGEGDRITVAQCCALASTSTKAARRYIDALAAKDLVRIERTGAGGATCLALTEHARHDMGDYLTWTIAARPA